MTTFSYRHKNHKDYKLQITAENQTISLNTLKNLFKDSGLDINHNDWELI